MLIGIATLALALALRRTVIEAATPVPIPVAFKPLARHVMDVVPDTQFSVFPAAISADPATALTEATSWDGYARVHCNAAELLPDSDKFKETEPPFVAEPDSRLSDMFWEKAKLLNTSVPARRKTILVVLCWRESRNWESIPLSSLARSWEY